MSPSMPLSARLSLAWLVLAILSAACGSSPSTGTGTSAGTTSGTGGHAGTGGQVGTGGQAGTGGLAPGKCHVQADCGSDFCGVQILPPFCGGMCSAVQGDGCQSDADCVGAGGLICDKPCACASGGAQPMNRCTKGCDTSADCGPSMVCTATHRCQLATCAQASDCTANFTCVTDAAGEHCAPRPCTKDADCGDFCVDGSCSPVIGTCNGEVP